MNPIALDTVIKQTSSLCPVCKAQIDAEVYRRDGKVYLRKACTEHGTFDVLINSDERYYYDSRGANSAANASASEGCCSSGCGCGPADSLTALTALGNGKNGGTDSGGGGHDPTIVETASTCIALIEVVETCNLRCPTCYADSPYSDPQSIKALTLDEFRGRVNAVTKRKGKIDILQLSGGEPTIHPQFFELMEWSLRSDMIGYVLLNTNGVLLARDQAFMQRLGELHQQYKGFEVYLQFDGTQASGQAELRGADLRKIRQQAIHGCKAHGVPVTLAMTVDEHNIAHLGDTLRFALAEPNVRGLVFQPMFTSGRGYTPGYVQLGKHPDNLNVADIILGLIDQSDGLLTDKDFTPLPCGDPNCHTIGYLIRRGDQVQRVSDLIDFSEVQGFLRDRINFTMQDLAQCGCESEELGHMLRALEIGPDDVLRLFIKPFMDAWTYDQDRIDRCCVHVIGEGGKLESFCRHYAMRGVETRGV
ncbi:MAG: radical SAM protein [Phycisphaerales bacterium]